MTSAEHNKYLAIAFFVHGCIHLLFLIAMALFFLIFFASIPQSRSADAPPMAIFGVVFAFVIVIQLVLTAPSFIAGYAIWKRKSWAKVAAIIGGVLAAMNFPIGTGVCVYTFWFFFSEIGKEIYDRPAPGPYPFTGEYGAPPQKPNLWQ